MNINYTGQKREPRFCNLEAGDTFIWDGGHYVKIKPYGDMQRNAMSLETYDMHAFDDDPCSDPVIRTVATINIH